MQQRKRTLMLAAVFLVAAAGVIAMRTWPTTGDEDQDRQTPEPRDASADVTADGEPSPGLRGSTDESPRPTAKGRDADPVETRELTVRVLASSNSAAVSDALVEVFEARKTSGVVVPLALVDGSIASGATSQQGTFVTKSAAGAALVVHVSAAGYAPARAIAEPSATELTVELASARTIHGTVRTASGEPLEGVRVLALSSAAPLANAASSRQLRSRVAPSELPRSGVSDARGAFSIDGLGTEEMRVSVDTATVKILRIAGLGAGGVVPKGDASIEIVAAPVRYFAFRPVLPGGGGRTLGAPFFVVRVADVSAVEETPVVLSAEALLAFGLGSLQGDASARIGRVVLKTTRDHLDLSLEAPHVDRASFKARLFEADELLRQLRVQDVEIAPSGLLEGQDFGAVELELTGDAVDLGAEPTALLRVAMDGMTRSERVSAGNLGNRLRDVHIRGRRISDSRWRFDSVPAGSREVDATIGPVRTEGTTLSLSKGETKRVKLAIATQSGLALHVRSATTKFAVLDFTYTIQRDASAGMWGQPPKVGGRLLNGRVPPEVSALEPGSYTVTVSRIGYEMAARKSFVVHEGKITTLEVDLVPTGQ